MKVGMGEVDKRTIGHVCSRQWNRQKLRILQYRILLCFSVVCKCVSTHNFVSMLFTLDKRVPSKHLDDK